VMEEAGGEEGSGPGAAGVMTNGNAAPKNGEGGGEAGAAAAVVVESPVKDSGGSVVLNGVPQEEDKEKERERLMKNGASRKRKKTIHYINSRVPHSRVPNAAAAPALESEEGSDGQDSPGEADDAPVRPSQAPRAAATKVGCSVLIPFTNFFCKS
jgi:hypothetical protein